MFNSREDVKGRTRILLLFFTEGELHLGLVLFTRFCLYRKLPLGPRANKGLLTHTGRISPAVPPGSSHPSLRIAQERDGSLHGYLDVSTKIVDFLPARVFQMKVGPPKQKLLWGQFHKLLQSLPVSKQGGQGYKGKTPTTNTLSDNGRCRLIWSSDAPLSNGRAKPGTT